MATGKYEQAPVIYNDNKPKADGNFILISTDLYKAINNKIDGRNGIARSLMYLLIGTATGFRLSTKYVEDTLGCSKSVYINARKHLKDLGFIDYIQGVSITINYDVIMGISEITPKNKGISEITPMSICENTPKGISEITHNIEVTNKETDNNGFSSYEEKPTAAPKQVGLAVEPEGRVITLTADELEALTTITKKALESYPNDSYFWINEEVIKSKATNKMFRLLH